MPAVTDKKKLHLRKKVLIPMQSAIKVSASQTAIYGTITVVTTTKTFKNIEGVKANVIVVDAVVEGGAEMR